MTEPKPAMAMNGSAATDLFSVDADAHLKKLAACMFPSPALLPVEMVRAALGRGAASIAVVIRRRRLSFSDDGEGISAKHWHELSRAFDPALDSGTREQAIDALQRASATGIGLLAVFFPDAVSIRIESARGDRSAVLEILNGRARQLEDGPARSGTRVTILRRDGPASSEKNLLRELCVAVPAAITLNGQMIAKGPLLRRNLVHQRVDIAPGREPARVAVPARGDVCRIWLLDRQIPWQAYASAPVHGIVFEAALESTSPPSEAEFRLLAEAAHGLYLWLARHYTAFPAPYQERIEELIFNRAKAASDLRLLSSFSPFRLWRSKQQLNLDEVRRKAEKGHLLVLPANGDPGRWLSRHQEALRLSPLQRDFLLNHLRLPLAEPPASMGRQGLLSLLFSRISRHATDLAARLPRRPLRALPASVQNGDETRLCRALEAHWRTLPGGAQRQRPTVTMAAGRGLVPALLRPGADGDVCILRRRHPLVILAARSVASDSANVELAFAALAPLELLTAAARWTKIGI
ncbi:MAG: hypothetical protein MUF02_03050 [Acidobacteria bacterium]|jgi:hypothetical protein|nr:hypothetical protein [Acidobacteriota bacterium]